MIRYRLNVTSQFSLCKILSKLIKFSWIKSASVWSVITSNLLKFKVAATCARGTLHSFFRALLSFFWKALMPFWLALVPFKFRGTSRPLCPSIMCPFWKWLCPLKSLIQALLFIIANKINTFLYTSNHLGCYLLLCICRWLSVQYLTVDFTHQVIVTHYGPEQVTDNAQFIAFSRFHTFKIATPSISLRKGWLIRVIPCYEVSLFSEKMGFRFQRKGRIAKGYLSRQIQYIEIISLRN